MIENQYQFSSNFIGHTGSVYALEKSNEGSFYTAGSDGIIAEWNVANPDAKAIAKLPHKVFSLKKVTSSILVAGTSSGGIYIIDLTLKSGPRNIQFDTSICYNILAISENKFATVHESGRLIIWDATNGSIIKASTLSDQKIRGICSMNDMLLVGTGNGEIVVVETNDWKVQHQFDAHKNNFGVNCIIHDAERNTIISGGKDGYINYWNDSNCNSIDKIPSHNYAVYDFAITNTALISCSRDKSIKIWDLNSRKFIQKVIREKTNGHTHSVNRILALNKQQMISVGDDKKVICWENDNSI